LNHKRNCYHYRRSPSCHNAAGRDEIRPEMLKGENREVLWLTRVCQAAWSSGRAEKNWLPGVIIPIQEKGDRSECTRCRNISFFSLPGKVYAKCVEKRCVEIIEPKLDDTLCVFRPGRINTDQIFTLQQIFEKSWEWVKYAYACFVDFKKYYHYRLLVKSFGDCYGSTVLTSSFYWPSVKSLYFCSEVCVVGGLKSQLFSVHRGCWTPKKVCAVTTRCVLNAHKRLAGHALLVAPTGSGVTDRAARGRAAPPSKLNVKTEPPLVDILIFSIL